MPPSPLRRCPTALASNCSCNCLAPKVILMAEGWAQADQFVAAVKAELGQLPLPAPYYPGIRQRYQAFKDAYPQASSLEKWATRGREGLRAGTEQIRLQAWPCEGRLYRFSVHIVKTCPCSSPAHVPALHYMQAIHAPPADPGAACGEPLPYLVNELPAYPADAKSEYAFRVEPFAPTLTFVKVRVPLLCTLGRPHCQTAPVAHAACPRCLPRRSHALPSVPYWPRHAHACFVQMAVDGEGSLVEAFLEQAVRAANEDLWGSLSCSLLVDPTTEAAHGAAVQRALDGLRYGSVSVNAWSAMGFLPAAVSQDSSWWAGWQPPFPRRALALVQTQQDTHPLPAPHPIELAHTPAACRRATGARLAVSRPLPTSAPGWVPSTTAVSGVLAGCKPPVSAPQHGTTCRTPCVCVCRHVRPHPESRGAHPFPLRRPPATSPVRAAPAGRRQGDRRADPQRCVGRTEDGVCPLSEQAGECPTPGADAKGDWTDALWCLILHIL